MKGSHVYKSPLLSLWEIPAHLSVSDVDRLWDEVAQIADERGACAIYRRGDNPRPAMARGSRRLVTDTAWSLAIPTDARDWSVSIAGQVA